MVNERGSSPGAKLRQLRKQARLSQPQLAARVNLNSSSISAYERNLYPPNRRTAKAIADQFGVEPETI